jgi:hypothetical protein
MEKSQGAIERGLHGWSARRVHVCSADALGAMAVLREWIRAAKRHHERRGYAPTQATSQHTQGVSIDRCHVDTRSLEQRRCG